MALFASVFRYTSISMISDFTQKCSIKVAKVKVKLTPADEGRLS